MRRCVRCCPIWKTSSSSSRCGSSNRRPPVFDLLKMENPLRGFGAIFYKEVLHMRRDSFAILFALIVPILEMIILGYAIDTNVRQVKTAVYDQSGIMESGGAGSQESRTLLDRFRNSDTFRIYKYVHSDDELTREMVAGRARVGLKIPFDFDRQLLRRETAQLLVLVDGSDSSVAGQSLTVAASIGLDESLRRMLPEGKQPAIEIRPKMMFNPDSRSPNFFLPGLMAVLGLMLGKIMPYFAMGMLEFAIILLFMRYVFFVPMHGNVLLLALLSTSYLFVNLAIGMLISTKANSQAEAMQLAMMTMLPSIFLSGYVFPRDTMPLPFYAISCLIPATYMVDIARGVILRGAGLAELWFQAAVLFVMGAIVLLLAARRFTKMIV